MKRVAAICLMVASAAAAQSGTESVLIRASKPYTSVVRAVEARGGRVTHQYKYVNAIAAEIPRYQLSAVNGLLAAGALSKDLLIPAPKPVDTAMGRRELTRTGDETRLTAYLAAPLGAAQVASIASANPNAYILNNAINGTTALHAQGILGAGVTVAVIDSGIRPGFPHLSLDGSVAGCEDSWVTVLAARTVPMIFTVPLLPG